MRSVSKPPGKEDAVCHMQSWKEIGSYKITERDLEPFPTAPAVLQFDLFKFNALMWWLSSWRSQKGAELREYHLDIWQKVSAPSHSSARLWAAACSPSSVGRSRARAEQGTCLELKTSLPLCLSSLLCAEVDTVQKVEAIECPFLQLYVSIRP